MLAEDSPAPAFRPSGLASPRPGPSATWRQAIHDGNARVGRPDRVASIYDKYQRIAPFTICSICRSSRPATGRCARSSSRAERPPARCRRRYRPELPYYPIGSAVVGIDLSPAMLARAERRRSQSSASVTLKAMDVLHLDFPDHSFDAAVATFLFCVLPEELQAAALRGARQGGKAGAGSSGFSNMSARRGPFGGSCRGSGNRGFPGPLVPASTTPDRGARSGSRARADRGAFRGGRSGEADFRADRRCPRRSDLRPGGVINAAIEFAERR